MKWKRLGPSGRQSLFLGAHVTLFQHFYAGCNTSAHSHLTPFMTGLSSLRANALGLRQTRLTVSVAACSDALRVGAGGRVPRSHCSPAAANWQADHPPKQIGSAFITAGACRRPPLTVRLALGTYLGLISEAACWWLTLATRPISQRRCGCARHQRLGGQASATVSSRPGLHIREHQAA